MKKIIVFVLSALMLISLSLVSFAADDFVISEVNFDVALNFDGTASVQEKWTIEYFTVGQGFDRYFDINNKSLSSVYNYGEIKDLTVKINDGAPIETGTGNNTYSFSTTANTHNLVRIKSPSAAETKTYTISYTLTDAIKDTGKNAQFAFIFVGDSFPLTSNNLTATITVPEGFEATIPEGFEGEVNGRVATITQKRCYDKFFVNVETDGDAFKEVKLPKFSKAAESFNAFSKVLVKYIVLILAVIFVLAAVVVALFSDRIVRFKLEKHAAKKFYKGENATISQSNNMGACEIFKMLEPYSRISPKATTKKITTLFAFTVLECMEKGYIKNSGGKLIIGICNDNEKPYIKSVMNFLKSLCEKGHGGYVLDMKFAQRVNAECENNYDVIANYLGSFYALIPSAKSKTIKNNAELYESAYIIKLGAEKEKTAATFGDSFLAVSGGAKTYDERVFASMFTSFNKLFADSENEGVKAIVLAVKAMNNVLLKSK